jgi:hypothetical protein
VARKVRLEVVVTSTGPVKSLKAGVAAGISSKPKISEHAVAGINVLPTTNALPRCSTTARIEVVRSPVLLPSSVFRHPNFESASNLMEGRTSGATAEPGSMPIL